MSSDGTRKKARTAPAKSACGRVCVSIANLDADVEPDDCMLGEKLRLIELAGIETKDPIHLCGCGAEPEIPRDVLRALRVLVCEERTSRKLLQAFAVHGWVLIKGDQDLRANMRLATGAACIPLRIHFHHTTYSIRAFLRACMHTQSFCSPSTPPPPLLRAGHDRARALLCRRA